MQKDTARQF